MALVCVVALKDPEEEVVGVGEVKVVHLYNPVESGRWSVCCLYNVERLRVSRMPISLLFQSPFSSSKSVRAQTDDEIKEKREGKRIRRRLTYRKELDLATLRRRWAAAAIMQDYNF